MPNIKLLLNETIKNVGPRRRRRRGFPPATRATSPAARPGDWSRRRTISRRSRRARKEIERQERERPRAAGSPHQAVGRGRSHARAQGQRAGNLFGSVSATDIAKALQSQGFNINPDDVNLPGKLDRIERYTVRIKFAEDLASDVKYGSPPTRRARRSSDAAAKVKAAEPPPPSNLRM